MKQKFPNLPRHIVKFNTHFYINSKTGAKIHKSQLAKHCPVDEVQKHNNIISKRYDLKQD